MTAQTAGNKWPSIATMGSAIVCTVTGALLLATSGGWVATHSHLWGYSFLIYIGPPLRLIMIVAVLAAGGLALAPRWRISFTLTPLPGPAIWLLAPLAGALFWLFREHTLHGDGLSKLQLLATKTLETDPYVWKEPLDSFVAYSLAGALRPWGLAPRPRKPYPVYWLAWSM